jgi:C4-dicarboxylate-specific signal transduction histidine kinase
MPPAEWNAGSMIELLKSDIANKPCAVLGMSKSQKKSPTRADGRSGGHPGVKCWLGSRSGLNPEQRSTSRWSSRQRFALGNSTLAARIRAFDWASTGIGPISRWSQPVRRAVAICSDIASTQLKKLVAARRAQHRRVTELSKQNGALLRQLAEKEAASGAMRLQFEVVNNIPVVATTDTSARKLAGEPVRIAEERAQLMVGTARDLTENIRAEEALREAREELARVTRLTAISQLSASITHEISQPLSAIVTNSSTCLHWLTSDEPSLEKARLAAQRLARDAKRASDISTHIRSLMGKTASERVFLDVNNLIRDALDLTQFELRAREISVQTELATSIPKILGDRVQLEQVILNLVLNSMEAMMPVQDRPRTLHVRSQLQKTNDVKVSFRDTGVGLDPASVDRIFEAFFTTKSNGTGMGLSICRSILEAHNGCISARPCVPHGAIFQFSLPSGR